MVHKYRWLPNPNQQMKRRDFIFKSFMAAIVLTMLTPKKARALIPEIAVALVILMIGAVVICKLLGLCRRLNQPKAPDKDDGASAPTTPPNASKPASIPIDDNLDASYFGSITDQSDAFKTPSGTFYTGMMSALVQTSTDLISWTPAGSFTAWFSTDYALVTQVDPAGKKSVTTIQNWQSKGIPAFMFRFPPSDKRYFRTAPNL